ncbi:transport and golgi organization 9 [Arctopsyche grandis]|uniref:transport and golgi organization 9 n=1 Tax=Arctopsyche grandis TaxID=121162 RepID=UPI00406D6DF4
MAWTKYQKFLALILVITGSINTLSTKWADMLDSEGSDGQIRPFQHPFLQSSFMFLGEMMCLVVFKMLVCGFAGRPSVSTQTNGLVSGNRNFSPFILMLPATLDLIATSTMYIGLNLTYASSFQMFRGSIIVFTAILSVVFLDKKIIAREWCGIGCVIIGLVVVGASDFLNKDTSQTYGQNSIITGDLLIVLAQIISATQMVYEEKYVSGLDIAPLQAVGWEGVFGFFILLILHVIFYYTPAPPRFNNNPRQTFEDAIDGLIQIGNNGLLIISVVGCIISIAFFNFAGISVTKEMSATTRMVLDSVRTLVIWTVSLAVGWQVFHWPQLVGFTILLLGTCLYNNILVDRIFKRFQPEDVQPIVNRDADDLDNTIQ